MLSTRYPLFLQTLKTILHFPETGMISVAPNSNCETIWISALQIAERFRMAFTWQLVLKSSNNNLVFGTCEVSLVKLFLEYGCRKHKKGREIHQMFHGVQVIVGRREKFR